ncbi:MAG: DUF6463 family protein [Pseudomonadota bacterium]
MVVIAAWVLLFLGVVHTILGFIWFKQTFKEAWLEGLIGKFGLETLEIRRLAFWFTIVGPLMIMGGNIAIHAGQVGDHALLKIIGFYLFFIAIIGVLALPKSPFWAAMLLCPIFIAGGYGWIG